MPRGINYPENARMYILGLVKNGQSIASVSKDYNISPNTIRRWIKQYSYTSDEVVKLRNEVKALKKENERLKKK